MDRIAACVRRGSGLGVFLLVIGATALFLIALAHQSLRAQRQQREDEERAEASAADTTLELPS